MNDDFRETLRDWMEIRYPEAHDAALLAAHPAPAFKTGWVNGENYIASNAAHPATAIDRETLARIIREGRQKWVGGGDGSYDLLIADALLASGVLNGQKESNDA